MPLPTLLLVGAVVAGLASAKISIEPQKFRSETIVAPGTSNDALAIATDRDGNIYLAGYFEAVVEGAYMGTMSNGTTGAGDEEIFLAKTTADGTRQWIIQTGTKKADRLCSIIYDSGFIYATGKTAHDISEQAESQGLDDLIVMKFDAKDGTRIWAKQEGTSGHDKGMDLAMASNGKLYLTGYVGGDWEAPSRARQDMFLAILDPITGSFEKRFQFTEALPSYGSALTITKSGIIYVGGVRSHMVETLNVKDRAVWKFDLDLNLSGDKTVQMFSSYFVKSITVNEAEDKVAVVGDVFLDTYRKFDVFATVYYTASLEERFSSVIKAVDQEYEYTKFAAYIEEDNLLLAGMTSGRMTEQASNEGKWAPWVMVVNQVGGVEHIWQKSEGEDGWEEIHAAVLTDSGDLMFAGLSYSPSTYLFETYYGAFGMAGVSLPPAPEEEAPLVGLGDQSSQSEDVGVASGESDEDLSGIVYGQSADMSGDLPAQVSGLNLFVVAGAGLAAFAVGMAVVVGAVIVVRKKRSLKDDFQSPAFGLNDDGIVRRRSTAGPSVVRIPKEFRGDGRNGARPV